MSVNVAKILSVGEHAHYPFKSYPSRQCDSLLFLGCAFPSQFPRTTDELATLFRSKGYGVAYDCCGNPLEGYGEQASADRVIENLNRRFKRLGCKRIVCVCPNCFYHLRGKVNVDVVSIFEALDELGVKPEKTLEEGRLFIPCPDKKTREMEGRLRSLCDLSRVPTMDRVACCGLRPDLATRGAEYSNKLGRRVVDRAEGTTIYTYCASCLGQFSRLGYTNCRHVVSVVLGIDEKPDSGKAFLNRAKRKFDRKTNPL